MSSCLASPCCFTLPPHLLHHPCLLLPQLRQVLVVAVAYPLAQPAARLAAELVLAQMLGQPQLVGLLQAGREQLRLQVRRNNQQRDLQVLL